MEAMTNEERAAANFAEKGFNCTQSVLCAYSDALGLDERTALRVAAPFGGGGGRQREMCGTVSGALMVLGMLHAPDDPTDIQAKALLYKRVQAFCARFREENGSTVCRELLGGMAGSGYVPEARTAEYYKKRPCARMCASAARILDGVLEDIQEGRL